MGRVRGNRHINNEDELEKRKAILNALVKASEDGLPSDEIPVNTQDSKKEYYYTLTQDEMEALISGDMQKIENWVSSMDRSHAIWLLCGLIKESW